MKQLILVLILFSVINAQQLSFTDVAESLGVSYVMKPARPICWGDYNNDDYPDLYLVTPWYSQHTPLTNSLFKNDVYNSGVFMEVAAQLGVDEPHPSTEGATWCDIDGDGYLDLYVTNNSYTFPDSSKAFIFKQTHFEDQATQRRLTLWGIYFHGIWGDYDNDGDPDVYVVEFSSPGGENKLLRNDGSHFTDVTDLYGVVGNKNCTSASWVDFDTDGDLDLMVNNSFSQNNLYENRLDMGEGFVDVADFYGFIITNESNWGSLWFDYDNDGDLDLFRSNSGTQYVPYSMLFRNDLNINGTFLNITASVGITNTIASYGSCYGDFDNDGDLDLYVIGVYEHINKYFRNDVNISGKFVEAGAEVNLNSSYFGFAAATADYDNDGDLDIYVVNHEIHPCQLYRNDLNNGDYLTIRLTDANGHFRRFGSRAYVYVAGTDSLVGTRVVDGGGSGGRTQDEYDLHFGLDQDQTYDIVAEFTSRTNGQNHRFDKFSRPELGRVIPSQIGHFIEIRDSVNTVTSLTPGNTPKIIRNFKLHQNYPNPFNATTTIPVQLDKTYFVELEIVDMLGRSVQQIVAKTMPAGFYTFQWNANAHASGEYICRMRLNGKLRDKIKLFLIK